MTRFYKALEGTSTFDEYGADFIPDFAVSEPGFQRKEIRSATAQELAAAIRESSEWELDLLEALCYEADMGDEWESADEDFETVARSAAEALGVSID